MRPRNPHNPQFLIPLSSIGKTVNYAINQIPLHYQVVLIDKYVIMPNHIHMIIIINNDNEKNISCEEKSVNDNGRTLCVRTVSRIIKQFKEYVTKQTGYSIWQKSYHDRIIRNEPEYINIAEYIINNPSDWTEDCYYS